MRLFRSFLLLLSIPLLLLTARASAAEATGFIHVKQIDGVWWFINAEGERFVSLGVNHIEPHLWLAPYNRAATLKRYGRDMVGVDGLFNTKGEAAKKWINRQVEVTKSLHFNTFGPHTHGSINPALYQDQIYYVARLDTAPLAGWRERNGEGPRPDVFSHDFRHFIKSRVKDVCAQHKDNSNLLGHLYSGESDLAAKNVYGDDTDKWLTDSFEKARAMGFNCALGIATSPERNLNGFVDVEKAEALFRENNFPYAVGVILLKHPWEFVDGETLPDIFEPSYEALIESRAAAICPKYKNDPLVMGYYYGFGAFNQSDQWVNHHLSLPANAPGRVAVVDVLIKKYNNHVAAFNKVYGTSFENLSDLKDKEIHSYTKAYERRNFPRVRQSLNPDILDDFESIIQHMCITLYKIGLTAIRKHDTNHLILGSFIKEWALDADSWAAAAPYVDVMAPQHVNRDTDVNTIARAIDKPIIFSNEYFGFHFPEKERGHAAVKSHDARGEIYRANLMRHFKDPQCIGVTYCACLFDQGGNTLAKGNQNSFYSLDGEPRTKLINMVTETNG